MKDDEQLKAIERYRNSVGKFLTLKYKLSQDDQVRTAIGRLIEVTDSGKFILQHSTNGSHQEIDTTQIILIHIFAEPFHPKESVE